MLEVTCDGIKFREDLGIIINKISPDDVLAEARTEKLTFSNIDGTVYKDNNIHNSYDIDIECTISKEFTYDKIRTIKDILKKRECELILSNKNNVNQQGNYNKQRVMNDIKARLISKVDFSKLLSRSGTFILTYEIQPFSELISGRNWINISSEQTLKNLGNYESKPLIKVTATGSVIITYNSKSMKFSKVEKPFIIDCELEDVYSEDGENLNNYMDVNSDFIPFPEGSFSFQHSGASKVEVMPRWREL